MATEQELQTAASLLSTIVVPSFLQEKISIEIGEGGSVTITNIATGDQTVITKENVAAALSARGARP